MKKVYMILAAIAALTMTANAQIWGDFYVGDPENATTYNGSYFDMAPTNFYVAHTGAQMLYTPDLLSDMNGKQNVTINMISFRFMNETFEEIMRNVRIYMQETDATEFAVVDGVKQFFPLGELVWEEERDLDLSYMYGDDVDYSFRLNFPYHPGKGLLVTIVCDALDDDNCTMGSDYAPFYTSGVRGKAMTYTNNWTGFEAYAEGPDFPDATAMLGCGTNVDLPLTHFQYISYEQTQTPDGSYSVVPGQHEVVVTITPYEGNAYYRIIYTDPDGNVTEGEWTPYVDAFSVTADGHYRVEFYAVADDKLPSEPGAVEFNVSPTTGIEEMTAEKSVASVRYYNMVGEEMSQANGMTIVVTTYTDGTTSAVKVMK